MPTELTVSDAAIILPRPAIRAVALHVAENFGVEFEEAEQGLWDWLINSLDSTLVPSQFGNPPSLTEYLPG